MALVRIYGPRELLDDATCLLFELGVLHPESLPVSTTGRLSVRDRRTEDRDAQGEREELDALAERVRRTLVLLPRPPVPAEAPPAQDVPPAVLRSPETARAVEERHHRVEEVTARHKVLADRLALFEKYRRMVRAILPLVERAGDGANLEMVGLTIARDHEGVVPLLEQELRRATDGHVQVFSAPVDEHTLAALVLYGRRDAPRVRELLWDRSLSEVRLPAEIARLPLREALAQIVDESERLPGDVAAADAELGRLAAAWRPWLEGLAEALRARLGQMGARASFFHTRYTFVVSGWVPRQDLPRLRRELEELSAGRIVVEEVAVPRAEEGRVPVHLRNPRWIRPFEVFVRLLPRPVYRTLDPTPLLALFFPAFFGMIVGDAGYGLVICALALLARRRFPRGSNRRDLATVLAVSAGAAVLFGLAFGEVFGTLGPAIGLRPAHPLLHRITAIPFFLGLSVGIGCLHVFLGLALGVANAVRTGSRAALWHRSGQAAALAGLILVIAAAAGAVDRALLTPAVVLLLAGLALWIAGAGFSAPLELLSTAGNVLSYARLMAVGLAGLVLAMVANELGRRSLWGIVAAVLLHLVNLVLVAFSPTIHAMRLHLVEFFTKFYETGGSAYKPLRRREGT